jgi:hypothetical protein
MAVKYVAFLVGSAIEAGIDMQAMAFSVLRKEREREGPVAVLRAASAYKGPSINGNGSGSQPEPLA